MLLASWFLGRYFVLPLLSLILDLILFRTVLLWTKPWLRRKFASWGPATGAPPSPASSARTPSSTRKSLTHRYLSGPSFTSQLIIIHLTEGTTACLQKYLCVHCTISPFSPQATQLLAKPVRMKFGSPPAAELSILLWKNSCVATPRETCLRKKQKERFKKNALHLFVFEPTTSESQGV